MPFSGGRPAPKEKWSWQVAIFKIQDSGFNRPEIIHYCGGTLVDQGWVLTAAHCVRKRMYVKLGVHDITDIGWAELDLVEEVIIHPDYNENTVDNDVALLKISTTPRNKKAVSSLSSACLPQQGEELPATHDHCTILGWGKRNSKHHFGTEVLHEAQVII